MDIERVMIDATLYAMEGKDPSIAIENEEKRQQQKIIDYKLLPIKTNFHGVPDDCRFKGVTDDMGYNEREKIVDQNIRQYTKQQYERMGIKIIGINEYDDMLYNVELPEGWKIEATGHYWSSVTDDKGRERISFFYKGGLYDRDAFCDFKHRYSFSISPFDDYKSDVGYEGRKFMPWKLFITDSGQKIIELKELVPKTDVEYFEKDEVLRAFGIQYLNENYPDWENINAYWD